MSDNGTTASTMDIPVDTAGIEINTSPQFDSSEQLTTQDSTELDGATKEIIEEGLMDMPAQDTCNRETERSELYCATSNSTSSNIPINKKQYSINHVTSKPNTPTCDLPFIDRTAIAPEEELPCATPTDDHLIEDQNAEKVTMLDNLPLLKYNDDLEDFETLMNIVDDNQNDELVPIDGPIQRDFVKEMNKDCGINTDLEIAMENAKFLDQHLLTTKPQSKTTAKNTKKTLTMKNVTIQTQTPGSPKGQLLVRTHGIHRLGPEETQDKIFKCTLCKYTGYSCASVSEHFSATHGVV